MLVEASLRYPSHNSRNRKPLAFQHVPYLFTRDINSAILTAKEAGNYFVVAVIVARNWDAKEQAHVESIADLALISEESPNSFESFSQEQETRLHEFIYAVLSGSKRPNTVQDVQL